MTSRRSALAAAIALLWASAATGCGRGEPRAAADGLAAHPLALLAPEGSTPLDRLVGDLQTRLRRQPRSAEAWIRLGEAWVRKAREAADTGLYRSAADCAEAALRLAPDERRALALRGLVLLDAHQFEEARRLAEELLQRDPGDVAALGILSDASLELGRFEEAVGAAQHMLDLKPGLPSYARASHLMWLQGDVPGALETARLAVDAGDPEPRAWVLVHIAWVHWQRGDLAGADAALDRALEQVPEYPAALAAKGKVALSRRDFQAAAGWLENAWRLAPLAETAWLLGDARGALGDERGAQAAYERVVRTGRAFDRRTLALFYATKNRDRDEAVRLAEAERAVRDDIYTEDVYAWALYRAGRTRDASAASQRAMRLGTPDGRLLYHAGAIRLESGDARAGLALIRQALRLNAGFDLSGAAEARRILAEARRERGAERRSSRTRMAP